MIDIPNLCSLAREDIGVTSIQNSHGGTSEELTASSTELNLKKHKSKQLNTLQSLERLYRWVMSSQT